MASCWLKAPHTDHQHQLTVYPSDGNWSCLFLRFQCKSFKFKTSYGESVIEHYLNDRSFFSYFDFFKIQFNNNYSFAIYAYCHQKGFALLPKVIKSSLAQ